MGFPINVEVKVNNTNGICTSGAGELVYRGNTIISKYLFQESGTHKKMDGYSQEMMVIFMKIIVSH